MPQPEKIPQRPESYIAANTYQSMAEPAVELYRRIQERAIACEEPVNFAAPTGLDVGCYDGAFGATIRALGVERVISIDPNRDVIESGEVNGMINPRDAFRGTLQSWVAAGNGAVPSVFVFNMLPTLPVSERFRMALRSATAIGGLLVASFRTPESTMQFSMAMEALNSGFSRLDKGKQPVRTSKVHPRTIGGYETAEPPVYNTFVQIYRRDTYSYD